MGLICKPIGHIVQRLPTNTQQKTTSYVFPQRNTVIFNKIRVNSYNFLQKRMSFSDAKQDEKNYSQKQTENHKHTPTPPKTIKHNEENYSSLPGPSWAQMRLLIISSAIPFLGFGFIDNLIMIIMGDMIDTSLCVMLGFSTMAAAAWGNLFSDILGIFSGGWIELMVLRMGFKPPALKPYQLRLPITRFMNHIGSCIGITIGCILGMCPLLFLDTKEAERLKHEQEKDELFCAILEELAEVLNAEKAALFLIDCSSNEMYTKGTSSFIDIRRPVGLGISGRVCATGQLMNVKDAYKSPYFAGEFPSKNGENFRTKAVLCAPIFGHQNQPIGVVEVLNTKQPGGTFSQRDEMVIQAIASHIAVHIEGKGSNFRRILWLCRDHLIPQGDRDSKAKNLTNDSNKEAKFT